MKLIIILNSFSANNWTQFLSYNQLHCDISSAQQETLNLIYQNRSRIFSCDGITTCKIKEMINSTISNQTFSNIIAILGNIAEEYLGWLEWKSSGITKYQSILIAYANKGMSSLYNKCRRKNLSRNKEKISAWSEYHRMQILYIDYYYQMSPSEDRYKSTFEDLLQSFYISSARVSQILMVEVQNRIHLLKESNWTDHAEYLSLHYDNDSLLSDISDQLILMSTEKSENAYNFLLNHLKSEQRNLYSHHINYSILTYCIIYLTSIIKEGEIGRAPELMHLQKLGLKEGLLTINNSMTLRVFLNAIGVAAKHGEFDSAMEIIKTWSAKVDSKNKLIIRKLGEATVHFYQKNYPQVIKSMAVLKQPTLDIKLKARWLYMMANFESNNDNIDIIKTLNRNFLRFIHNSEQQINKSTFLGIKASIKILDMILSYDKYEKIVLFYKSQPFIFERTWVIQKIKDPKR